MIRVILALVFSVSAFAQATVLASTGTSATGFFPSTVTTSAINTTGATLLVVGCTGGNVNTSATLTDSASNTGWTTINVTTGSGTSAIFAELFYLASPITSATHTFTCTANAGGNGGLPCIGVIALGNTPATGELDASSSAVGTNTGNIVPTQNCDLFVALGGAQSGFGTVVYPSGFTGVYKNGGSGTVSAAITFSYFSQGALATLNPATAMSLANGVAFKASSCTIISSLSQLFIITIQ